MSYFPQWKLKTDGVIAPDERLPANQMVALGLQHVVAMFGSTILAPILMGFDPNVAVLMSGVGTLLFFLIVGGHVPSYLCCRVRCQCQHFCCFGRHRRMRHYLRHRRSDCDGNRCQLD